MTAHDEEVWDFSLPDKPKRFRFNGPEVYEAPAVLGPATLRKLANSRSKIDSQDMAEKFNVLIDLFDSILTAESAARLRKRLEDEANDDSVDMVRQLVPCLHKLMEAYGLRPTKQSPPSAAGGGKAPTPTSSTAGARKKASTPKRSKRTAGAT